MRSRSIRRSIAGASIALGAFVSISAAQRAGGPPAAAPTQANVMIPMRDGVQLGADVYLPTGSGPFPVLLTITPYGKNATARAAAAQLAKGYAVVAVDSRGLRASQGKWEPYIHEARDGYDVQQWVGHQPWCDGNIGMFGTSYPAYTQVAPAQYRSPYVKALIPVSAQSDNYGSVWGSDGIVHLAFAPRWAAEQEAIAENKPAPQADWNKLAWVLPLKAIPNMTGNVRSQFLADVFTHEAHDSFWNAMSIADKYGEDDVPALHVTGWFDDLSRETQTNFTGFSQHGRTEAGRKAQHLLIGPWGHGVPRFPDGDWIFGDVNFGPDVKIDFQNMSTRWFDHYLKGVDNGVDREAPVKIFVMGLDKWRDEQEWPVARAKPTAFYFHSKGWANSRFGNGTLSTVPPTASESTSDTFRYDPRNPVPTYGGHGCCDYGYAAMGPLDQKVTEERPDVLVYTTDVLGDDTEVTGIPKVDLVFRRT